MSHSEAVEDNVRFDNTLGESYYYPTCHICGNEVSTWSYKRIKYTCKNCKKMNSLKDKENRADNNQEAKEKKFENAVARISSKCSTIKPYIKAAESIHEKLHKDGWFQSTEEIIAAIVLVKNNIKARHQVKLGRYCADFVLPEEKIVLEIDGTLYHTKLTVEKEKLRDNLIVLGLGVDWEVIRITDILLNENPKNLVKAIMSVKARREKLRKEYNGLLPRGYTRHE